MADVVYQADITYQEEPRLGFRRPSMDWSAIWAGLFSFVAIWSVFGVLGLAIFGNALTTANVGRAVNVGMGIWAVILTFISMYIAGLETGKLAGLDGRVQALTHGMVMFGLSMSALIVLTMSGRMVFTEFFTANGLSIGAASFLGFFGYSTWFAFLAVLLGWLGAMAGAVSGIRPKMAIPENKVRDIRPAA